MFKREARWSYRGDSCVQTNQTGSSLEEIQEEAEAIMRRTSFPRSRLTTQRTMMGVGGQEGRLQGLNCLATFKQAGKDNI